MKKNILLAACLLIAFMANSQTWDDTVKLIEKAFERYKPNIPGAQLAISRHGQLIYSKAWGMADMEHNVPLTTASPTEAGSVSKQFTAAAMLLLEQQGKLSMDDDVRKYVPELPDYGHVITLRQMMQHASGLKDWGSIAAMAGWPRSTKTYNNDDALYIASLQKTLNHKPGDEFIYSNSNYNLFAVIVQRVSGSSLADFSKKYIFEPAGMKHTEWRANFKKVVPNRALAYAKETEGYITNMPNEYVYGNGGLLTTAEDLLTWTHYYSSGKFGSPSLLSKQLATNALNNGAANSYAAGLFIRKYNGIDIVSHDGATASYRANLEHFPSLGLTIAWLSNSSEFDINPVSVTDQVRNIFIKRVQPQNPATNTGSEITLPAIANNYTGWYRNNRTNGGLRLYVRDGKLYATSIGAFTPVSDRVFAIGANRLELLPGKRNMVFITAAKDSIYLTGVDSASLTPAAMNDYAGEYYSTETESRYFVKVKDGKLVMLLKPKAEIPLNPTFKDGFDSPAGTIYFERDRKNKVTAFKVSVTRARNVEARKL